MDQAIKEEEKTFIQKIGKREAGVVAALLIGGALFWYFCKCRNDNGDDEENREGSEGVPGRNENERRGTRESPVIPELKIDDFFVVEQVDSVDDQLEGLEDPNLLASEGNDNGDSASPNTVDDTDKRVIIDKDLNEVEPTEPVISEIVDPLLLPLNNDPTIIKGDGTTIYRIKDFAMYSDFELSLRENGYRIYVVRENNSSRRTTRLFLYSQATPDRISATYDPNTDNGAITIIIAPGNEILEKIDLEPFSVPGNSSATDTENLLDFETIEEGTDLYKIVPLNSIKENTKVTSTFHSNELTMNVTSGSSSGTKIITLPVRIEESEQITVEGNSIIINRIPNSPAVVEDADIPYKRL